jgi:hypothetical protein
MSEKLITTNKFIDLINVSLVDGILNSDYLINNLNNTYLDDILIIDPIQIIEKNTGNHSGFYLKKLIYKDLTHSIYLLEWDAYQETPLHNHYFSGKNTFCYFCVLSGEFIEKVPSKETHDISKYISKTYPLNSKTKIDKAEYLHILKNNTDKKQYTLHIYPE